ncbi:hypothetical protein [Actinotalea sp. C106]|uniref:ParB family protein n=1 Tax=Actinotalea sp. C106 TaxID=2908644 RepID=UPI002027E345|nr:hypothetical protein [Actinotalea sp. C106]
MSTDEAPQRTISGLKPPPGRRPGVHPDASRLLARNRQATPAPAVQDPAPTPALVSPQVTVPQPAANQTPRSGEGLKEQLNVSVLRDVRRRIRAAYRATSVAEGHRSFSDFVTSLLEAEARRLENTYNGGQPFTGGERELPAGRPLSD